MKQTANGRKCTRMKRPRTRRASAVPIFSSRVPERLFRMILQEKLRALGRGCAMTVISEALFHRLADAALATFHPTVRAIAQPGAVPPGVLASLLYHLLPAADTTGWQPYGQTGGPSGCAAERRAPCVHPAGQPARAQSAAHRHQQRAQRAQERRVLDLARAALSRHTPAGQRPAIQEPDRAASSSTSTANRARGRGGKRGAS